MANITSIPAPRPELVANPINVIILPVFSGFAIITMYLPMRDFYRKGNFAACSMIVANTVLNTYQLINVIIWHNDNHASWFSGIGLCDVQNNSRYMLTTALLTSVACFTKNLANVFNTDSHSFVLTRRMKYRQLISDILFIWLLPFMQVALHYIITLGRFSVYPVFGCYDEQDPSWPYVVLDLMWGPIFALLCAYYAGMSPSPYPKLLTDFSKSCSSAASTNTARISAAL
jgi:pheromone a factor receptor